jgi:hypothetical protein
MGYEIQTAEYLTQVEGEEPRVRIFGLIPQGYEGLLSDIPDDDGIYYWLDQQEWDNIKAGQEFGDAIILEEEASE